MVVHVRTETDRGRSPKRPTRSRTGQGCTVKEEISEFHDYSLTRFHPSSKPVISDTHAFYFLCIDVISVRCARLMKFCRWAGGQTRRHEKAVVMLNFIS